MGIIGSLHPAYIGTPAPTEKISAASMAWRPAPVRLPLTRSPTSDYLGRRRNQSRHRGNDYDDFHAPFDDTRQSNNSAIRPVVLRRSKLSTISGSGAGPGRPYFQSR